MTRIAAALAALVASGSLSAVPAAAAPSPAPSPGRPPAGAAAPRPAEPDRVLTPDRTLGAGWRSSRDRAVTTSGDETGLHVLVADAADAYRWVAVATLAEPGFDTDQWIGQLCVTGSGRRAVVVYAPRQFTNQELTMQRGGFAAVVDLGTGAVTKLPDRVSLAYHNPGCGTGETAVLSRLEPAATGPAYTWLETIDAARPGRGGRVVRTPGQVTSALPHRGGLFGVKGYSLVGIGRSGAATVLARLPGSPHRLMADGPDAVAFQVKTGDDVRLSRYAAGRVRTVATVPSGTVRLRPGAGGRVYAVGGRADARVGGRLPSGWRAVDAAPDSEPSTTGALIVTGATTGREAAGPKPAGPPDDRVHISAELRDGTALAFSAAPEAGTAGLRRSPALATGKAAAAPRLTGPDYSTVPYDPDATCAVPRNDPALQVYQPTPAQVEWAADLAVAGGLTVQRPANWLNSGLPTYSPQAMFPPLSLSGGGAVPAQVLLGILAQESNLWQASFHAVDGSAGNPLTSSGYYGIAPSADADPRAIDWSKADCGYGVAQVTSGMHKSDTGQDIVGIRWDATKQKAVALDYATNIAAGLRILQDKWNVTRDAGLIANNGEPGYLENWWFAIWAYNTGFHGLPPVTVPADYPWGVGWSNNVANQDYPADRQMYLTAPLDVPPRNGQPGHDDQVGYDNAKHPNDWAYPERVIGYAYTSLRRFDYQWKSWSATYRPAMDFGRVAAQPGRYTFCSPSVNACDPAARHVPADYPASDPGPCLRDDLKCWWHGPANWANCPATCGLQDRAYTTVEPRPYADNIHPTPVNDDGTCAVNGLPAGARIIDDITTDVPLGAEGCRPDFTRGGTFGWRFGSTTGVQGQTIYPSKVDLHQIGGGFGGHFWFAHTMPAEGNDPLKITGIWTADPTNAWTRVFVHVPDHGAETHQADYRIFLPGQSSTDRHRAIPTRWEANTWLDIGVFDFRGAGNPRIELSNVTQDGRFLQDIAWDAVAVQPLPGKPRHQVVAMGDSISAGEGADDYTRVSDQYGDDQLNKDACRRSEHAWSRQVLLPGSPDEWTIGARADAHNADVDFHHIACAGARTQNLVATRNGDGPAPKLASGETPGGMEGELTQIDQGFLDENTTLVLLNVGANDARWADLVRGCAFDDCLSPDFRLSGDDLPATQAAPNRLRGSVRTDVGRVLSEIKQHAPNALVVLAGYPQLFKSGTTYDLNPLPGVAIGVTGPEVDWLNDMARLATTELLQPDLDHGIAAVDVRTEFAGHELGTPDTNVNWINGYRLGDKFKPDDDDGEPSDSATGAGSFHPNASGYHGYADAVADLLNALDYRW